MKDTVSLTIDKNVLEEIRKQADVQHRSVSNLIETILKDYARQRESKEKH